MKDSSKIQIPDAPRGEFCPHCPMHALIGLLSPSRVCSGYRRLSDWLEKQASMVPPLLLRLVLAYEFWEAGMTKLYGENWFADLGFPFPFSLFAPQINWWLATGFELIGAIALTLGVATRFFSFALVVITAVAIVSVHWPSEWASLSDLAKGYTITDEGHGNYKLPVLYFIMLLPLLFGGAGRFSLDAWFADQKSLR
jgi:putative oxidoreductase